MSRKTADYDDDDFYDEDDYEEGGEGEEELSPEDRAAMDEATAEVRKTMGADFNKVTLKQVEDSLWHYFYDVEKTVAYLKKTYLAPPAPKPAPKKAPEGMFNMRSFVNPSGAWGQDEECVLGQERASSFNDDMLPPTACPSRPSMKDFFADMPWGQVPEHRQTNFTAPVRPRGGLLGGGEEPPKMSKLQALAAARKKKAEEKAAQGKGTSTPASAENDMKRLSISEAKKENERPGSPFKKQKTVDAPTHDTAMSRPPPVVSALPQCEPAAIAEPSQPSPGEAIMSKPMTASSFARTLFGSAPKPQQATYAMPYTASPKYSATAFSQPSPDDVVFQAQAKAGKKTPVLPKAQAKAKEAKEAKEKEKDADKTTNGLGNLKISDVPPPKSKGLDVLKEFENDAGKRSISFVVVGHVDAGKSTLMGRLLLELKHVEQRTVDKYRRQAEGSGKSSFALAWVMDQREEERERGVTIDIATNRFETEKTKFTILDAPGHRDFVPNMIAGASQADFAILVIDGNTGAFEKGLKGQTREHVLLLRSLGVQRLIIGVNKLDMVGWSKDRFDEISQQVGGFLTGLGFLDKHVSFIPISGLNGDNIVKPIEDAAASWYTGSTLIDALEASEPTAARALTKPFRFAISEVFRSTQGTTTLSGRVDAGTFQVGDAIAIQPSGETAYVKSIVMDGAPKDYGVAGQHVNIALTDIDPIHIRVGDILCPVSNPILVGDTFTMKAMAFEHLMPMPVDLHRGRLHAPGQVKEMLATIDKATGAVVKKRPKVVQPGQVARVTIKLSSKVPLEAGQRVVIRSAGETVAAGLLE